MTYYSTPLRSDELYHYGIKGMRWGVRKYRNPDGSLTRLGKIRYEKQSSKEERKAQKRKYKEDVKTQYKELKNNKSQYGRFYTPGARMEAARYMVNNKMDSESARKSGIKKQAATLAALSGARLALGIAKYRLEKRGLSNKWSPGHKTLKGGTWNINISNKNRKKKQ